MMALFRKFMAWLKPTPDHPFGIDPDKVVNKFEYWYLCTLKELLEGREKADRTGTGTISTTFMHYKHDLRTGHPVLRSRWLPPMNPVKEMFWMLSGSNNVHALQAMGVPFWNSFADETGDLGPIYGFLWRHWPNPDGSTTDQIEYVRKLLKEDPDSRRMVVSCWHPSFIPNSKRAPKENYKHGHSALTACHYAWQVVTQVMTHEERVEWFKANAPVAYDGWFGHSRATPNDLTEIMDEYNVPTRFLDLKFDMRSNDFVLGNPANFGMYATLAYILAGKANMVPRFLCYAGMDVHVYGNHIEGVREQLKYAEENPELVFMHKAEVATVYGGDLQTYHDIDIVNYDRGSIGPAIKFPIAV